MANFIITGRVVRLDGTPWAGVPVRLLNLLPIADGTAPPDAAVDTTDSDGAFAITAVARASGVTPWRLILPDGTQADFERGAGTTTLQAILEAPGTIIAGPGQLVGGVVGPQGPVGAAGAAGAQGPAGATGATGPAGATGATGSAGVVAATAPLAYNSGTQTISAATTSSATNDATKLVLANHAALTDPRTPTAHKSSHATGGSDVLLPSDIGAAIAIIRGRPKRSGLTPWTIPGCKFIGTSARSNAPNRCYSEFMILYRETSFDAFRVRVSTAASGTARFAIYAINEDWQGIANGLKVDLGTVDTSTTGNKTISYSLTLPPGIYVKAASSDNASAFRTFKVGSDGVDDTSDSNSLIPSFYQTLTYGAFPSTLPNFTTEGGGNNGFDHAILCRVVTP